MPAGTRPPMDPKLAAAYYEGQIDKEIDVLVGIILDLAKGRRADDDVTTASKSVRTICGCLKGQVLLEAAANGDDRGKYR